MFFCFCFVILLLMAGCSAADPDGGQSNLPSEELVTGTSRAVPETSGTAQESPVNEISYTTPEGETGYLYISDSVLNQPEKKVPMVLMMMSTGGEARQNAKACGWADKAMWEDIIVLAPNYNNYATYSELPGIVSAVEYVEENYPVDTGRVYATGFSNGGAVSVALASEYPQMFAAISSYGWMVDMRSQNPDYDMPFQVIQGTEESTYATDSGAMAIMEDEQRAIRSLFLFNEMIDESVQADYDAAPYWGYVEDDFHSISPDGREWGINDFYKDGYTAPFAQLVLIDEASHQPNTSEADVSWEFFRNFSRDMDGSITEQTTAEKEKNSGGLEPEVETK